MEKIVLGRSFHYTTKTGLRLINQEAERRNYNRRLITEAIEKLPDDTIVGLQPILIHEHAQGRPVEPHLRCFIFADPDPVGLSRGAMIDVPMEIFSVLVPKEKLLELLERATPAPADPVEVN